LMLIIKIKLYEPCQSSYALHELLDKHAYSLFLVFRLALVNKNYIGNPCYLIIDLCDMVGWMEPSSSLQSTWDFFYKIIKNSIAWLLNCLWNSYPRPYVDQIEKPSTYASCYLIELCQIVVTLWEKHFIFLWSRSRTHPHHLLCFYTRS
jgi:hypothetical protein